MIRILQINLNGCQAAQDVMIQTAEERRADLVIVSEQYRNIPHRWYSDASSRSAIYTPTAHLRITNAVSIGVQGWTWVEMRGVRFYSCYFSPSATIEEFKRDLVCLEDDVRTSTLPVVVAGDFNSKAPEWGSQKTDRRGILLSEMASHLHLHAANVGSAYTFVRGSTGSVIDVTFAGETIIGRIRKWQVLDSYSHSDHRYIGFELEDRLAGPQMLPSSSGWGARKLDIVALDEAVAELRSKSLLLQLWTNSNIRLFMVVISVVAVRCHRRSCLTIVVNAPCRAFILNDEFDWKSQKHPWLIPFHHVFPEIPHISILQFPQS
ncbi:uncharacterized protein LOC143918646 [Arctopsyche grandis]|uniref:uncharacterized protein LOC143918646 n=2 Tax=Arctopsyche grandis TaxID=121162 RepID=UPI00406D7A4E